MEYRRAPESCAASAREASARGARAALGGARAEARLRARHASIDRGGRPTRYFAGFVDDLPVSSCELYSRGGVGQVEDVVTLEEHRGHGLASAAVLAAVRASVDEGNTLTFLLADADDWPYLLYERLGFETTGRRWRFQRLPT